MAAQATGNPAAPRKLKVQRTVFGMESFETETVGKMVDFQPVADIAQALAELNNDQAALVALINKGRESAVRDAAYRENTGWFALDDKNQVTDEAYDETITEPKHVNQTVSTLARTIFGLSKGMSAEQKKSARESAMKMVRDTPVIREGLAKRAAEMQADED